MAEQAKQIYAQYEVSTCNVDNNVKVKIPDVDRGRGDLRSIILTLPEYNRNGLYKFGKENGIIQEMFPTNQFAVYE